MSQKNEWHKVTVQRTDQAQIDAGTDVYLQDNEQMNALICVAWKGHEGIVKQQIKAGTGADL